MVLASVELYLVNCIFLEGAKRNILANKLGSTFSDDREHSLIPESVMISHNTIRADPTSFPGSLFSVSLGRWKKDPGCGWSRDHPESGWQKNMLGGRGGRVFCLLLWQTLLVSNLLAVAKHFSLYRRSKSNLSMKNDTRFLPSSKHRRLSFTKKFGSQIEQKLFDG